MKFHEWIIEKNAILVEQDVDANKLNFSDLVEITEKFLFENIDRIDEITGEKGCFNRALRCLDKWNLILRRQTPTIEECKSLKKILSTFNWTHRGNKLYRPLTEAEKEYNLKYKDYLKKEEENDKSERFIGKKIYPDLKEPVYTFYIDPAKMIRGADIEVAVIPIKDKSPSTDVAKAEPPKNTEPKPEVKPPEVKPANVNVPLKPSVAKPVAPKPAPDFYLIDDIWKSEIKSKVDSDPRLPNQQARDAWYIIGSLGFPFEYQTEDPEINKAIDAHKRVLQPHLNEINKLLKQTTIVGGRVQAAPYEKKIKDVLNYVDENGLNIYIPPEIRRKYKIGGGSLGESVKRNFNDWIDSKSSK